MSVPWWFFLFQSPVQTTQWCMCFLLIEQLFAVHFNFLKHAEYDSSSLFTQWCMCFCDGCLFWNLVAYLWYYQLSYTNKSSAGQVPQKPIESWESTVSTADRLSVLYCTGPCCGKKLTNEVILSYKNCGLTIILFL